MLWHVVSLLMLGQVEAPLTSADALLAAHADIAKQPEPLRPYLRYLSTHALTTAERKAIIPVLRGHVHHLSRASDLPPPTLVAGGLLLRVNLQDYGWSQALWERLPDPYFGAYTTVEKTWPAGKPWSDGKVYPAFQYKQKILAHSPVDTAEEQARLAELYRWTGSALPVTRADWFFNQTAAQVERNPGYYDFLGIKTVADFETLVGFDRRAAEAFEVELREAVALSGVTLQPRAIARWNAQGGGYWRSFDFKLAKAGKNPLRVLGVDIEKEADASEGFGLLANRFWATYAADAKGLLQAAAPGDIASDHSSKSNDRQVHANISCIRCHTDGGLQEIDGWTRNLLNPPLKLNSADYLEQRKRQQQYLRKLEPFLEDDRRRFSRAVLEATGLLAKDYATAYAAQWERYEDAKVDAAWAARDLGLDPKTFKKKLLEYLKAYEHDPPAALDLVVSAFLHEGPRARAIGIRQWEEAYPLALQAVKGTLP